MISDTAAPSVPETRVVARRVAQFALDLAIVAAIGYLASELAAFLFADPAHGPTAPGSAVMSLVLAAVIWVGWFVVVPAATDGRTVGMRLLGLRVVRADDGGEPTAGQHVLRFVVLIVDTIGSGLVGLITMLRSQRQRRLGDMAAGTLVVRG